MVVWWLGCLILLALFVIFEIWIGYKTNEEELRGVIITILSLILLVLLVISGVHSWGTSKEVNIKYEYKNKINVYSIEDNFKTNGTFFLGCGEAKSELYYYVMIGNDADGYVVKKYNAERTRLIPQENIEPYYVEKYKHYDEIYGTNFLFGGLFKSMKTDFNKERLEQVELHLPKNYIKKNYNIDMKN